MVVLFHIDFTGLSNSSFQFSTNETCVLFSFKKILLFQEILLPDIDATFVLVIVSPSVGGTWQSGPNYLHFGKQMVRYFLSTISQNKLTSWLFLETVP